MLRMWVGDDFNNTGLVLVPVGKVLNAEQVEPGEIVARDAFCLSPP